MESTASKHKRIKVICEACAGYPDTSCPLCAGAKFYFWEPQTGLCFTYSGQPIMFYNNKGEALPVLRNAAPAVHKQLLQPMLDFIEDWVSETPVRKWKLTLDENGWQSCVWFNRYKRSCFETHDINFESCIARTYYEIKNYQAGL